MHPSFVAQFPLLLRGVVSKAKVMQKTVTVTVPRRAIDRLTKKEVIQHTKYLVHDEKEVCNTHDVVRIASSRRYSKRKTFELDRIEHKADRAVVAESVSRPAMSYAGWKLGEVTNRDLSASMRRAKQEREADRRARFRAKLEAQGMEWRPRSEAAVEQQARPPEQPTETPAAAPPS
ncbi:nucleic acid-binding protein [Calocera cornea HHB12733]|uniref:Nucleic acid-binding protein n=1 Tax=Calocera cornea HHB12733 TaxID=1353952 RepID=A0A165K551_9BASI|nr:nucleic acid-binding protein [Calocera cornea HHB12733]